MTMCLVIMNMYVHTYGTNHPQLKQSTCVTHMLSSCHTCAAFVVWEGVLLRTHVNTRVYVYVHAHKLLYAHVPTYVCTRTRTQSVYTQVISARMYIQSRHI